MRILFVGDSLSTQYVSAFYNESLMRDKIEGELFEYGFLRKSNVFTRLELHYKNGLLVYILNKKLLHLCKKKKYDLVFVYYSTLLYGSTVRRIKDMGCKVFMYCNDNPFSDQYRPYIWRHLKRQIPYYDIIYAYRESNISDYEQNGAKCVKIMRSYYISKRNYYIPDEKIDMDVPAVVFIGHMENDERREYIKALLDENVSVGVNHAWTDFACQSDNLHIFSREIATEHYNELINKAKIAIVFLSKLNGDTYTRRCFEIPAAKTLMIAPYTDDLAKMYKEDEEIVFYENKDEFVKKIKYYLIHSAEREKIAVSGYERLIKSKNEIRDRFDQILSDCGLADSEKLRIRG